MALYPAFFYQNPHYTNRVPELARCHRVEAGVQSFDTFHLFPDTPCLHSSGRSQRLLGTITPWTSYIVLKGPPTNSEKVLSKTWRVMLKPRIRRCLLRRGGAAALNMRLHNQRRYRKQSSAFPRADQDVKEQITVVRLVFTAQPHTYHSAGSENNSPQSQLPTRPRVA